MRSETALMVDIETMGVNETAAVMAIGACFFDPYSFDEPHGDDLFNVTISLDSNHLANRTIDPNTVQWWMQQSPEAIAGLFEPPIYSLQKALTAFRIWAESARPTVNTVWANDPDFDIVILKNAMSAVNMRWPFHFAINRSVRTIKWLGWTDGECTVARKGTHHRAVDDAVHQARVVQVGINRIMKGTTHE